MADFIGTMNFFDARVQSISDGTVSIDAGPLGKLAASPGSLAFSEGQSALAAIRPEKISISRDKPASGIAVEGVMDASAYLGDRSHFYVRINGVDKPVAVSAQNMSQDQLLGGTDNSSVWLSWADDAVVLLSTN